MLKNIFKKDNLALDDEVVGVVYRTRDYSKFKFSKNNRNLNVSQVARLVKSMTEKVITTIITVNDNMEIKDGQHRFESLKQLKKDVNYFVDYTKDDDQDFMIISNNNSKNWVNDDYLQFHLKKEEQKHPFNYNSMPYHIFQQGRDRGISFGSLIKLVYNYENKNLRDGFRSGNLTINDNKDFFEKCDYLKRAMNVNGQICKHRCFQSALINLLRRADFDGEYFLRKIEKDPYLLETHSTITGFESVIKKIYNHRNKNKIS
tara:strand:+ start:43 stop:822 length:780 start_codon:yes stop_codon:yes gene_type:complete